MRARPRRGLLDRGGRPDPDDRRAGGGVYWAARAVGAALISDDEYAFSTCMTARNAINDAFDALNIWVSRRHR
jgi:hypothetical protein